jgi:hypothetical protein
MKGMEELKKSEGQTENVQKVVDYLKTIHTVRHSSDEHQVARLIEQFSHFYVLIKPDSHEIDCTLFFHIHNGLPKKNTYLFRVK